LLYSGNGARRAEPPPREGRRVGGRLASVILAAPLWSSRQL
jgi:hypothetical protein